MQESQTKNKSDVFWSFSKSLDALRGGQQEIFRISLTIRISKTKFRIRIQKKPGSAGFGDTE
jgi:hypothetical protein